MNKITKSDHVCLTGDFNARVGNISIPGIAGTFGEYTLNRNGQELRQFASFNELKITNTFFRKRDIHKYTWTARGQRSLIDYVLVNNKMKSLVQDVRVFRGSEIGSDHFLVIAEVKLQTKWKRNKPKDRNKEEVYKVYLLQDESIKLLYQKRLQNYLTNAETKDNVNEEWESLKLCIEKSANEVLGRKRKFRKRKGLRIWNEEIEKAIKEKKIAYNKYIQLSTPESYTDYKSKRNYAKDLTRTAHQQSWEKYVSEIEHDVHGRQLVAYKILKHLSSSEKDTVKLNIIADETWKKHYEKLWCNPNIVTEEDASEYYTVDAITLIELRQALKETKNRKACGPDGLNSELLKYGGFLFELRFLHLLNECWKTCEIPSAWQTAEVISLFKKGDRNNCENYRGISLLNSASKIYSRIINNRIKGITDVFLEEEQVGFRKGRSCSDNVFTIKQIIEKRREYNLETHIAFIDIIKAFDKVNRSKLWEI